MNKPDLLKIEEVFGANLPAVFNAYISDYPKAIAIRDLAWSDDPGSIKATVMQMFEDSLRFDIENSEYWPRVFGEKPESFERQVKKALEYIATLPPLMYASLDDFLKRKPVSDEDRQLLRHAVGWNKVFDGLGADNDELYV